MHFISCSELLSGAVAFIYIFLANTHIEHRELEQIFGVIISLPFKICRLNTLELKEICLQKWPATTL